MARTIGTILLVLSLLMAASTPSRAATMTAQEFVQVTSQQILDRIATDRSLIDSNQTHVYQLIDEILLPHIDFQKMSRSVLGKYWRQASEEQRNSFMNEFRLLLVRTYSTALIEYSTQTIDYLPLRSEPDATDVTVRTEIKRGNGPAIPISYDLYSNGDKWLVYDVSIDRVSLVANYRSSFASEIRRRGFDSLISLLQSRNAGLKK